MKKGLRTFSVLLAGLLAAAGPAGAQQPVPVSEAVHTAKRIVQQGGDRWFFLAADYGFGEQMVRDASKVVVANGGKVLGAVKVALTTTDMSSFLLQAQSSGANVVGVANAGADAVN